MPQAGSALVAVLWIVVILTTVMVTVLDTLSVDTRILKNSLDEWQTYYAALGGAEYAKAMVYKVESEMRQNGVPFDPSILNRPLEEEPIEIGRATFRWLRMPEGQELADESGYVEGLIDEERYLSLNAASAQELAKLPDIDTSVVAALIDWRDPNQSPENGGAEAEYYQGLEPSIRIRNAPFETMREVLAVKGVTEAGAFGEDANANGLQDPSERDGEATYPFDNGDALFERGWTRWLTLESAVPNLDPTGLERILLSTATVDELAEIEGLGSELAEAIVLWRDERSLESLADLLNVKRLEERPNPNNREEVNYQEQGDPLIDQSLFVQIADRLTTIEAPIRTGVVNLNTASMEVLSCLPGLDEDKAQAIVDYREREGYFVSTAELLNVPGLTVELYKGLEKRTSVRSATFRVLCEGAIPETNIRRRIQMVFRLGEFEVETLSYREDL